MEGLKALKNKTNTTEDSMGLSPKMLSLTLGCPSVFESLLSIVNQSVVSKIFPTCCKRSIIIPIPKVVNPSSPSDYRPISIQANLAKVI